MQTASPPSAPFCGRAAHSFQSRKLHRLKDVSKTGYFRCRAHQQSEDSVTRSDAIRGGIKGAAASILALKLGELLQNGPAHAIANDVAKSGEVRMRTLPGSELAVGFYPRFDYNSAGGGGTAKANRSSDGKIHLTFDPNSVSIPNVTSQSTKFLGVPLIPFVKIDIKPTKLEGVIDQATGEVQLEFDAEFNFSAPAYKAPPLFVNTLLTTETVKSTHHSGQGKRLNSDGYATLTGTSDIAKTGDAIMDNFLVLPTDVIAVMKAQFIIPESL